MVLMTPAPIPESTVHHGLEKLLNGHLGMASVRVPLLIGFGKDMAGMITIDTYYLSMVLNMESRASLSIYGMFAIAIYEAGRRSLFDISDNEDRGFLLPITVSLITFIIIKSVFSQQDNHPVVFMMLGASMALAVSRQRVSVLNKLKKIDTPLLSASSP